MPPCLPDLPSSPPPLLTSDPAIHLHSQADADADADAALLPSDISSTDDLEGLALQRAEVKAARSRQGIVIQHRAWKVAEAFRSEEDHIIGPKRTSLQTYIAAFGSDSVSDRIAPPKASEGAP